MTRNSKLIEAQRPGPADRPEPSGPEAGQAKPTQTRTAGRLGLSIFAAVAATLLISAMDGSGNL